MIATNLIRNIGIKVREKRNAMGISQKQLAHQCGVSERLLRSLEMGTAHGIGLEKLVDILIPLDLSLTLTDSNGNTSCEESVDPISQGSEYTNALQNAASRWHVVPVDWGEQ